VVPTAKDGCVATHELPRSCCGVLRELRAPKLWRSKQHNKRKTFWNDTLAQVYPENDGSSTPAHTTMYGDTDAARIGEERMYRPEANKMHGQVAAPKFATTHQPFLPLENWTGVESHTEMICSSSGDCSFRSSLATSFSCRARPWLVCLMRRATCTASCTVSTRYGSTLFSWMSEHVERDFAMWNCCSPAHSLEPVTLSIAVSAVELRRLASPSQAWHIAVRIRWIKRGVNSRWKTGMTRHGGVGVIG
jgi:hypothetical protein